MVRANPGTASPPSMTAAGAAACLRPKRSPWRHGGTDRVKAKSAAGLDMAAARPPTMNRAPIVQALRATVAIPICVRPLPMAASWMPLAQPRLSTTRPSGADPRADTPKKTPTSAPNAATLRSRSSRIWTASAAVRNTGRTPAAETDTATVTTDHRIPSIPVGDVRGLLPG